MDSPWTEAAPLGDDAMAGLTLEALWRAAGDLLAEGADMPGSPLRRPVLSTANPNGTPHARIVILRGFEPGACRLLAYTDGRTAKAVEIRHNPLAAFTFYDSAREVQLRLSGRVALHRHDELAERAWRTLGPRNMADYLARAMPGSPSAVSGPDLAEGERDEEARKAAARRNFAVLAFTYDRLDMLVLGRSIHRRALFTWTKTPASTPDGAVWLTP